MKHYIFVAQKQQERLAISPEIISEILDSVAENTDTSQLITALYLLTGAHQTRGVYLRPWIGKDTFRTNRGKWSVTMHFPVPDNLPDKFRLIRMRLDGRAKDFPKDELDGYGWCFRYHRFEDQLATLFAHELHHYRRYHLNLHEKEGEHSANRWALLHTQALGYHVSARRIHKKRHQKIITPFSGHDPYKKFRHLKAGDALIIQTDPRQMYTNQIVRIVRPIRNNSKRMVIKTQDGKKWRWPMTWLKTIKDQ